MIDGLSTGHALTVSQAVACFALATWNPLWLSHQRGTPPPPRKTSTALDVGSGTCVIHADFQVLRVLQLVNRLVGALWLLVWAQSENPPSWFPSPSLGVVVDGLMLIAFMTLIQKYSSERPVALQLVRPVSHVTTPTSLGRDNHTDSFSALSLSGAPPPASSSARPTPPPQPVFGKPSLGLTPPPRDDSEPMDWEPTGSEPPNDWDSFGVGQQSIFPRTSEETGLEPLLATWGLGGEATYAAQSHPNDVLADVQMAPAERSLSWICARLAIVQQGLALCRAISACFTPTPGVRIACLCAEALVSAVRALLTDERWTMTVNGADAALRMSSALAIAKGVQLPLQASVKTLTAVEGMCWALLTLCVRFMTPP